MEQKEKEISLVTDTLEERRYELASIGIPKTNLIFYNNEANLETPYFYFPIEMDTDFMYNGKPGLHHRDEEGNDYFIDLDAEQLSIVKDLFEYHKT